jgi:hypothetical protein
MNRTARLAVLTATLVALSTMLSTSAGAVTWHNIGSTGFHATGGIVPQTVTYPGAFNNVSCRTSTATADAPVGTFSSSYSMTGTLTADGCILLFGTWSMHCGFRLTAVTQMAGAPAITTGAMDMTCSGPAGCHTEGSTPAHYVNPNGATPGQITLTASSTLSMTHATGMNCLLFPRDTYGTVDWPEQTLTLTGGGPFLTRTA